MSHKQAALKIKHWYLLQSHIQEISVRGNERFTLFDKIVPETQSDILRHIQLNPSEIPVLLLTIAPDHYIINTSERFLKITPKRQVSVYYNEFYDFENFASLYYRKKKHARRTPTKELTELAMRKTSGEVLFWKIPTGHTAYYFWNVTRLISTIQTEDEASKN